MNGVVVAQLGARRHYVVPYELYRHGLLNRLKTDIWVGEGLSRQLKSLGSWGRVGKKLKGYAGRRHEGIPTSHVDTYPFFGLSRFLLGRGKQAQTDYWADCNARFCGLVARGGFNGATCVYAFNAAALEIFQAAKKQGLRTILDQTAAPWRWNSRMLSEEMEEWPGWEDEPAEMDRTGRITAREEAEWMLSDHVVCGSEFCLSTFQETAGRSGSASIVRFPYYPGGEAAPGQGGSAEQAPRGTLKVLFLGTLQLRKGIQYFYEAARLLKSKDLEFRAVGPIAVSRYALELMDDYIDIRGRVSRLEVANHYQWADVLVLPTLSEGAANVVTEAMAAGLVVVTTRASGATIRDGVDGFLVPERDPEAITRKLQSLHVDRELVGHISGNARQTVVETVEERRCQGAFLRIFDDEMSNKQDQLQEGSAS